MPSSYCTKQGHVLWDRSKGPTDSSQASVRKVAELSRSYSLKLPLQTTGPFTPQTVTTVQWTQPNGQEHGITQSHEKPLIMVPHSLKEDAHASQLGARPSKAVAGLSRSYSPNPQRFCPSAKKVALNRASSASNLAARRQPILRNKYEKAFSLLLAQSHAEE